MNKYTEHIIVDDGTSIYPIHISEIEDFEIEEDYQIINSFDNINDAFNYCEKQMEGRSDQINNTNKIYQ